MAYNKDYEKKTIFQKRDEYQEELRLNILEKMKEAVKYKRQWIVVNEAPYNPVTGTKYSGNNLVGLALAGFSDPRWLTFNGIQEAGKKDNAEYRLKKGSKALNWCSIQS